MSHQSTIHPDLLDVFQEAFDATSLDFTTVDDVEVQNGRNASAIARFDRAGRVHLKRMEGPEREQRYARTVAFEHWRCGRELHFHAPTLLAHDENHTCVAFGFVDSETNVGHAVANGTADVTLLEQCMAAIGSLHCQPVDPTMDTSLPEYPPQHVGAVGLAYMENATFGELSLWQILQHDRELAAGLARLAAAPFTPTPIHGDFRPDQVLFDGEGVIVLDWEEFRAGDPCRDLGAFLGEVLHHGIRRFASGASTDGHTVDDHAIVQHGVELISQVRPVLQRCRRAYPRPMSEHDEARLLGFIGWHLFDRALVNASVNGRLGANDRALAGIGRKLLLGGSRYADTIGIAVAA